MNKETIEKRILRLIPSGLLKLIRSQTDTGDADELLSNSASALVYKIAGMICGYSFILLITRNFGAYVMGIFAISVTVLDIFAILGRLGLETVLLRFVAEYSAQGRPGDIKSVYLKAVSVSLPFSVLCSIMLYVSSNYLSRALFHNQELTVYFRAMAFAIPVLVLFSLHLESLRGLRIIRKYAMLQNLFPPLFASSLLLLFMIISRGTYLPLIAYIASLILVSVLSFLEWLKSSEFRKVPVLEGGITLKSMIGISFPLMLSSSLFLLIAYTDTVMLGILRTEEEVGIYNVAMKITTLASITLYAINTIAAPKFAELYGKDDMKGLAVVVRKSSKLIFWSSLPVLIVMAFFPSFILGFFGDDFRVGGYALLMLTLGQFVNTASGSVGYILKMTGKQNTFQKIIFLAAIINIGLNMVLIPRFGLNGAAFASMISIIFWNLSSAIYIRVQFNITTFYVPGFRYLGLSE